MPGTGVMWDGNRKAWARRRRKRLLRCPRTPSCYRPAQSFPAAFGKREKVSSEGAADFLLVSQIPHQALGGAATGVEVGWVGPGRGGGSG